MLWEWIRVLWAYHLGSDYELSENASGRFGNASWHFGRDFESPGSLGGLGVDLSDLGVSIDAPGMDLVALGRDLNHLGMDLGFLGVDFGFLGMGLGAA